MQGNITIKALHFSAIKHRKQRRRDLDKTPYINHPIAVSHVLSCEISAKAPEWVVAAALLHDTIEDTNTTFRELCDEFGEQIANLVNEVSDPPGLTRKDRKQLQVDKSSSYSYEAKLIKLADKICNMRDIHHSPPPEWSEERIAEYFGWAGKVFHSGLRGVHDELESLFLIELEKFENKNQLVP